MVFISPSQYLSIFFIYKILEGKMTYGKWWMPWEIEAMKDVGWLRKASGRCLPTFDPGISEWGNPMRLKIVLPVHICEAVAGANPLKWNISVSGGKEKKNCFTVRISLVAASEEEVAQTLSVFDRQGVVS